MTRPRRIVTTHPGTTESAAKRMERRLAEQFPEFDWIVVAGMRGIYSFPPPPPEGQT